MFRRTFALPFSGIPAPQISASVLDLPILLLLPRTFFFSRNTRVCPCLATQQSQRRHNTECTYFVITKNCLGFEYLLTLRYKKERRVKRINTVIACISIPLSIVKLPRPVFLQPGFTQCELRKNSHSYSGPQRLPTPVLRTVRCGSSSFKFSILSSPSGHQIAA